MPNLRHRLLGAACTTAIVGGVGACAGLIGVEDFPPENPKLGQCGGFLYAEQACATCVDKGIDGGTGCCAEADACRSDSTCASYFDCVSACGESDATCRVACRTRFPAAWADQTVQALETCRTVACGDTCADYGSLADFLGVECAECAGTQCGPEAIACAQDPQCRTKLVCYSGCVDPYCTATCNDTSPSDATTSVEACVIANCAECAVGTGYACVGAYTTPLPVNAGTAQVNVGVYTYPSGVVEGASVQVCGDLDMDCLPSGPALPTGSTGNVTVPVQLTAGGGFTGYFDITKSGTMLETLLVPPLPVIGPIMTGTLAVTREEIDIVAKDFIAPDHVRDDQGVLLITARDCYDEFAQGLEVKLLLEGDAGPSPKVGYHVPPMAGLTMTDTTGLAVAVNVPPGLVTIVATVAATGKTFATVTVPIRSTNGLGLLTAVNLHPQSKDPGP